MLDLASTPKRVGAALRQAEVLDLALLLQLLHLLDRLLNGRHLVQAVAVVEVDVGDAEALQRTLARLASVLRGGVDVARAVLAHRVGELGREEDVLALAWVLLEPLACGKLLVKCPQQGFAWKAIPRRSSLSWYMSAVSQKRSPTS